MIEHGIGGDERCSGARRELRQCGDAGAIVAAIRVTGGEVKPRVWSQRLLDAAELWFEVEFVVCGIETCTIPPPCVEVRRR